MSLLAFPNKHFIYIYLRSPDSSVGIATGNGLDGQGSFPGRDKIFLFSAASYPMGTGEFSPGVKRSGREADTHLHLVKRSRMAEPYPHSPTASWHSASLIKHRDFASFPVHLILCSKSMLSLHDINHLMQTAHTLP
jgi:hypothetical protein